MPPTRRSRRSTRSIRATVAGAPSRSPAASATSVSPTTPSTPSWRTGTDEAWAYTAGLNWYLNRNFKLQFNYERTDFDGKPTFAGKKRDHEDVLLTRFQISY